ncbi:proline rich transmembrane protein 1B-like [Dysidea avara]|uniref:proline rich transmembrane protein 1B-like n=1 Tax=Dysidea avara TaxID=196820 RepID=UPI003331C106
MSQETENLIPEEAPPPYAPPDKPEEPPPAYFPEEDDSRARQAALRAQRQIIPPNVQADILVGPRSNVIVVRNISGCAYRQVSVPPPPDYTCMAVIATIFFFPVGVFAIAYAMKAREAVGNGEIVQAWKHARTARILSRLSFIFWTLLITAVIVTIVVSANGE